MTLLGGLDVRWIGAFHLLGWGVPRHDGAAGGGTCGSLKDVLQAAESSSLRSLLDDCSTRRTDRFFASLGRDCAPNSGSHVLAFRWVNRPIGRKKELR